MDLRHVRICQPSYCQKYPNWVTAEWNRRALHVRLRCVCARCECTLLPCSADKTRWIHAPSKRTDETRASPSLLKWINKSKLRFICFLFGFFPIFFLTHRWTWNDSIETSLRSLAAIHAAFRCGSQTKMNSPILTPFFLNLSWPVGRRINCTDADAYRIRKIINNWPGESWLDSACADGTLCSSDIFTTGDVLNIFYSSMQILFLMPTSSPPKLSYTNLEPNSLFHSVWMWIREIWWASTDIGSSLFFLGRGDATFHCHFKAIAIWHTSLQSVTREQA